MGSWQYVKLWMASGMPNARSVVLLAASGYHYGHPVPVAAAQPHK